MATLDTSPAPTRRLSRVLRRRADDNASTPSILSQDSGESHHGLKGSLESAREKIRNSLDSALHDGDDKQSVSSDKGHTISKLLPKNRKKKKERTRELERQESEEAKRGRSVAERGTLEDPSQTRNGSIASGLEDEESSLLTEDEDPNSQLTTPALSTHPSQVGYLTLSSSRVQNALTTDASTTSSPTGSPLYSSPLPVSASDSAISKLAVPRIDSGSKRRSPSPFGKFKDTISKRTASPRTSPDRQSGDTSASGGKASTTDEKRNAGSRRASMSSRRASKAVKKDIPPTPPIPVPGFTRTDKTDKSDKLDKSDKTDKADKADKTDKGEKQNEEAKPFKKPPVAPRVEVLSAADSVPTTPATTVTPPTPVLDQKPEMPIQRSKSPSDPVSYKTDTKVEPTANIVVSPSGNMISHRRVRSASAAGSPSKLSTSLVPTLTPTLEETKTPGGSLREASGGGFFSSVFSAAQTAATSLTNSINTSLGPQSRARGNTMSSSDDKGKEAGEEVLVTTPDGEKKVEVRPTQKLAVETLGQGDLDLSQLGITVDHNESTTSFNGKGLENGDADSTDALIGGTPGLDGSGVEKSLSAIIRPSTATTLRTMEGETPVAEDMVPVRSTSTFDTNSIPEDQRSLNGSDLGGEGTPARSRSVRSRAGTVITRKHRGSSAATAPTIASALAGVNATVAHPASSGSLPRLTGFAVASKKRNRDFHQLFRSVPEDDYLIEDYGCALQRDILLQGRLYVSEGHICFSSNILGWVTNLVISFDEVMSIEKKSTAMIFPNAIVIQTLHARNVFASFISRDSTYDLLIGIWKINHPSLRSSVNGVRLDDAGTGDKTVKEEESLGSDVGSDDGSIEEIYDEDEDEEELGSYTEAGNTSIAGSDFADADAKAPSRKPSAISGSGTTTVAATAPDGTTAIAEIGPSTTDFPGPSTHSPTTCTEQSEHYDKVIKDETIPAPLGKIYTMMFGPASDEFMSKWLAEDQKCTELTMPEPKGGISQQNKSRSFSYIKPLNGSIGPKQTKCIITETIDFMDLERSVSVTVATQTPDVPSGNVFTTKTKYCLMWAEHNSTRLLMGCTIEWTGKSWLKGPIEKGANDGQVTYARDLVTAIKSSLASKRATAAVTKPGKSGKTRRKRAGTDAGSKPAAVSTSSPTTQQRKQNWGLFEPLRPILGPAVDIFGPLATGNAMVGILGLLLFTTWLRLWYAAPAAALGPFQGRNPERLAAYDELWQREESELWDWLEERVGIQDGVANAWDPKQDEREAKAAKAKASVSGALKRYERMKQREMDAAIEVTEERLQRLKEMVDRQREQQDKTSSTKPKEKSPEPAHEDKHAPLKEEL